MMMMIDDDGGDDDDNNNNTNYNENINLYSHYMQEVIESKN